MGRKKRRHGGRPGWHGRVWLEGDEGTFIGYGRAVLLEKIDSTGSISQAAKAMEMSYRHAWRLVESMNRQAGENVVITCRGGKAGGGTVLSPRGKELLNCFWQMQERFESFLAQEALCGK